MQVKVSQAMVEALKGLGHVPENLKARFDAIAPGDGGQFVLKLNEEDATELAELVQWYIRTDADTGKPTKETAPLSDLISLIDEAQF